MATTSVEIDGEKIRVCSWHKRIHKEYGTLQPPSHTRRMVSEVDPEPDEDDDDLPALTNGNGNAAHVEPPRTMRERIERSAEQSYDEIEAALRRALPASNKPRGVKCPNCGEGFKVNLPDHTSAIASAKVLLELVVSRPKPADEPTPPPSWEEGAPDLSAMSTADLYRVAFGREMPPVPVYEDDEDEAATG